MMLPISHVVTQGGADERAQQGEGLTVMPPAELVADDPADDTAGDHASRRVMVGNAPGVTGFFHPALPDKPSLMFMM